MIKMDAFGISLRLYQKYFIIKVNVMKVYRIFLECRQEFIYNKENQYDRKR